MKRLLLILVVVAYSALNGLNAGTPPATTGSPIAGDDLKRATLHIPFIKNVGQASDDVAFYADTFGGALLVKKQGQLELVVPHSSDNKTRHAIIGETFVGAKINAIKGSSAAVTKVSYFLGNKPENWHSNIPTYETVSMGDIYDDIELRLKAYGNNVEKLFHVRPGADPGSIRVKLSGIESINITESGSLALNTIQGVVQYSRPSAYQIVGNERHMVDVAYRIKGDSYGFDLGEYDIIRELIIDPLLQSTYFGGSGDDVVRELGIAPNDNVYVVGHTDSVISSLSLIPDGIDAFVAHFSPALAQLQNVSFIGGNPASSRTDEALAVAFRVTAVDSFDVYVAGNTSSPDLAGVEAVVSADDIYADAGAAETEGFVAWFSSDLTLLRTTYYGGATPVIIGGNPNDSINAIAINNDGVFITGTTSASDIPLVTPIPIPPPTQGAFGGGNSDVFITQLSFDLTDIMAATYLGGTSEDEARDLVLDSDNAIIAGHTGSTDFPGVTAGVFQETKIGGNDGTTDAFVSAISLSLTGTINSTYIGGAGNENVQAIVNTGTGTAEALVYLAGTTTSADFPLGAATATFSTQEDNFIARINKDLVAEYQATYLGGNGTDMLWDMALHKEASAFDINTDSVYVTGSTQSTAFQGSAQGEQEFLAGTEDAFIMRIDASLTDQATYQMTYLGGAESAGEFGYAIAVDVINGVYVGGVTTADDFPVTANGADTIYGGGTDGFVSRHGLSLQYVAEIRVSPTVPIDFGDIAAGEVSAEEDISIINADADNDLIISSITVSDDINYLLDQTKFDNSCDSVTVNYVVNPGESCRVTVQFRPQSGAAAPYNATVTITSNDFDEAEKLVFLTGTGGSDSDGVPDAEEMGSAGNDANYDGNGDGIADLAQASAASLHSQNDAFYVTIATTDSNLKLENVTTIPSPADLPEAIQAPFGYYSYAVSGLPAGGSATVRFFLNSTGTVVLTGDEEPDSFWKYGPQPADPATSSWYEFAFDSVAGTGAVVDLNTVTLSFIDGQRGDRDLTANGIIEDPGAPVKLRTTTVAPAVDDGSSGICFIATAAYGSYMHEDVKILREFRDDYLLTNTIGRKFVSAYYRYSPPVADVIAANETLRTATRWLLTPLVYAIKHPYLVMFLVFASGLLLVYRQQIKMKQTIS